MIFVSLIFDIQYIKMHNDKYPEKQLRNTIITEKIGDIVVHYSICKKEQMTMSFLKNDRLFYFDETSGIIFYINQIDSVPIKEQKNLPKPKGDICYIKLAVIKPLPKTSTLSIQFNKKNDKNQIVAVQWNFTFQTVKLSRQWAELIRDTKNKMLAKALGLDEKDKDAAEVINDTLAFGMLSKDKANDDQSELQDNKNAGNFILSTGKQDKNKKQQNPKNQKWNDSHFLPTESQVKPKEKKEQNPSEVKKSSMQPNKEKSGQKDLKKSQVKPLGSNSNIKSDLKKSEVKPLESSNLKSDIKKSQVKNQPASNQPKSQKQDKLKPIALNRSSLVNAGKNSPMSNSRADNQKNPRSYEKQNDWNKRFLLQHDQSTILDFRNYAEKIFMDLTQDDLKIGQTQLKQISRNGLNLKLCKFQSNQAPILKNQFKNYHHILAATQDNILIHVPLTCIISYMGIVCLAKAILPDNKQKVEDMREIGVFLKKLESLTKISNSIWRRNGQFWDLTQMYGKQQEKQRKVIFIDNLFDYLPLFNQEPNSIRSELLEFEGLNSPLQFNSSLTNDALNLKNQQTCEMIANVLSDQQIVIANYLGLKSFLHALGINMSQLPKIYHKLQSRQSKKLIHSALIAKTIHKQIMKQYSHLENREWKDSNKLTETLFKYYFEEDNENGQELWKKVAMELKKKYRMTLNPHEIQGGFLLSSVILMLEIDIDSARINKQKQIILDSQIFTPGFIKSINPQTKIYHKFRTTSIEKCLRLATSKQQVLDQIVNHMKFDDDITPGQKILSLHMKMQFYSHLSKHISHFNKQKKLEHIRKTIYSYVNAEPVSVFSHQITMQYLSDCLKENKIEQYKKVINLQLDILTFWCGQDHMYVCDIFQSLSDFYAIQQSHQDCINFMKQALTTCVRSGGTHTRRTGIKYYQLGTKQLMFGFKNEAFQNFLKAKSNMETFPEKSDQYPLLMNKLASLYLNKGDLDNCVALTIKALQESQNLPIQDSMLIKNYLLLCRAYQIKGQKAELQNLGHLCAKVFNNTGDFYTFDQMVRICMTTSILTLPVHKQEKLSEYLQLQRKNKVQNGEPQKNLEELMMKARSCLVMQKFMSRMGQIDRLLTENIGNRQSPDSKEAKWYLQKVIGVVGEEFIEGILSQAQYFA